MKIKNLPKKDMNKTEDKTSLSRRHFLVNSSSTLALGVAGSGLLPGIAQSHPGSPGPADEVARDCNQVPCKLKHDPGIEARYERARALFHGQGSKSISFNSIVYPHWIGDSDHFWYKRDLRNGHQYRLVDAATANNKVAFDHDVLARSLARASGEKVDADNLPLGDLDITLSPLAFTFSAFDKRWVFDDRKQNCREMVANSRSDWVISPDGKKAAFVRDYNLWVRDLTSDRETQLTRDGEKFNVYAGTPTAYGRQETVTVEALWSPDSKRVFTVVIDTRQVKVGPPLVQHVPLDGSLRPKVLNPDRRVAFPGDEHIEGYRFLAIEVGTGNITKADYRLSPVFKPPYVGFFSGYRGWWHPDNRHACFIDLEQGGKVGRLVEFDTHTGKTRVVIEESSDTHFTFIPITHLGLMSMPLPDSDEVIWYSERSGWAHLYLYDRATGRLKNPVTRGNWMVRNILHYDADRRELTIQTGGRKTDRNPYYCDICRVNIDTGELSEVVSTDHNYVVLDQRSRYNYGDGLARGVSSSGRYVVTSRTREDQASVSVLLDRDGRELLALETADISALPRGWQWPEFTTFKGADGKTDIHGLVFRPSDFDPKKSYPVIDSSIAYGLPTGSLKADGMGGYANLRAAALAELGFIVVVIAARGTALRGKTFAEDKSPVHHRMFRQDDCIAWIQHLAERYPYVDVNRAGVGGQGSSPMAITGMLGYPDFYKVGVTWTAIQDSRVFAAFEKLPPADDEPLIEDLAGNLKGKLLLCHGLLDQVTTAAQAFRMIYAFQKANRDVDMLILPNDSHGMSNYGKRRSWDYFVRNLQGVEPPADFEL